MRNSKASAEWNGIIKSGKGGMNVGGQTIPFSLNSRMEGGAEASSPEELLAGALAGCYSMALTSALERAGFSPEQVHSDAQANFDNKAGMWTVETIDLDVSAKVPGIEDAKFQEIAEGTRTACPVARALTGVKIGVKAKLV
jgi:osmotically inducible protein OsmC